MRRFQDQISLPTIAMLGLVVLLGSCSSPPKPATIDESTRRPANSAAAVELQTCRSELQNTRILANESGRLAQTAAVTLEQVAARQHAIASLQTGLAAQANAIFTIRFDFGSTRVVMPAEMAAALAEAARTAPLVLLRGRTDGVADTGAESRIARDRAAAVRDHLVGTGVDPARIRATYQPAGDHVADNASAGGRGLNRRVEVEVYRVQPVPATTSATTATIAPGSALP